MCGGVIVWFVCWGTFYGKPQPNGPISSQSWWVSCWWVLWNAQGKMVLPFLQCKHVLLSMLGLTHCQKVGLAQFLIVLDLQLIINIIYNNQYSTTYKIMYTLIRIRSILQHKNHVITKLEDTSFGMNTPILKLKLSK